MASSWGTRLLMTVWLFTLLLSMLGIKQTTQCTRAGCLPPGLGTGKLFRSTLTFLLFHPSQEGLLVLLPGFVLASVLLWSECPPLRGDRSFPGRTHVETLILFILSLRGQSVWPGTSHQSGECLERAWHHLSGYPGEVQDPAVRGQSDTQPGLRLFLIVS